jgi:hypothetical protein
VPLRHSSAFFSLTSVPTPRFERFAEVDEALGRVGTAVEQHVFDQHFQLGLDLLVDLEHAGVDDAHVHAGGDGVIEKRGVHGLAHLVVAAEAERDVRDAAAHLGVRQVGLDPARGVDEVDGVVVVLLHAGGDGEDVGIEDDVFGRKTDFVDEDAVGALADADLVFVGRGLALFVEGHHHHGRAVFQHGGGVVAELLFAFFERDGVDDALALQALEAGLDDLPLGGVDHEGDLGDLGLAGQQLQVAGHGGDAVDHALVHADVDDVGAVLDLLAGDAYGFFVFAFLDQLGELGRTGDVGALADHDVDAGLLGEGLRSGEAERLRARLLLLAFRCARGSRPRAPSSASERGARGACPSSALAMAAMCSGVLPQQPPAMLIRPPAQSRRDSGHVGGPRSKPVSEADWAGRRSGSRRWPRPPSPRALRGTDTSGRGRASS